MIEKVSEKLSAHLHFDEHVWLHESGRGHEEGGVGDAARGGDDLSAAAVDRLARDHRVQDLELAVPDGLLAERTLSRPCRRNKTLLSNQT